MSPSRNGLKLLCDENLPRRAVELLSENFDVKRPLTGSSDAKVAELGKSEARVLVTFDRHFANTLMFPPEKYFGIVFVRISPPLIETVHDALMKLFETVKHSEFKGKLFVVSPFGYRVYPKV